MRRALEILGNLTLTLLSLAVLAVVLEFVVFRYILVPDGLLRNVTINQVVRYEPNTRAVFRHPDQTQSVVTINAQGWNSRLPYYETDKIPGRMRIAIVGDSYVHGAFVNVEQGFPAIIERQLQAKGYHAEVYRFGMDGAPLSQYLHVLRREVVQYRPDIVVVPLIHNDFDESYRLLKTRYASSFMKLRRAAGGNILEVQPTDFDGGWPDRARASAVFRYLYSETGLTLMAKRWISRYFSGGAEDWDPNFVRSAVDVRKIRDHRSNRAIARYVLREMKALSRRHNFKLVIAMDAVREAIYARKSPDQYEVGVLNTIAAELTAELELPFVDLQEVFRRDFAVNGQRFEFEFDWHWNVRGNELAGRAIARLIEDQVGHAMPADTALIQTRAVAQ
ncbi:MAG: alginate O-acetyltransferase AlgX-related protein [Hyphomicrobiaceae bacterium]